MPAPTALLAPEQGIEDSLAMELDEQPDQIPDDALLLDSASTPTAPSTAAQATLTKETRKIPIPPHRMSAFKSLWTKAYPPLVQHLHLQVRFNVKSKAVELRTSKFTQESGALQKGADFIQALSYGFELEDAIAMLRLDDMYMEVFEIKDVRTLNGDHLGRAIARVVGKDGKTKFAIENSTRTRLVIAGQKIRILGGYKEIRMAREAVVSLILGKQPGMVYKNLQVMARKRASF